MSYGSSTVSLHLRPEAVATVDQEVRDSCHGAAIFGHLTGLKMLQPRKRLSRSRRNTVADVQSLETRQMPTGIVTARFDAINLDLVLSGDRQANDITVTSNALNGVSVTGNNGTSIRFNNQLTAAGTPVQITLGQIRDISASLGNGDDVFLMESQEPTAVRNLTVWTGQGNDSVAVQEFANSKLDITGNLYINTESGNDRVDIIATDAIDVTGNVTILTGAGNDAVGLIDNAKFGAVVGANLAATVANIRAIVDDSNTFGNQAISVDGNVAINTGIGDDAVAVLGIDVTKDLSINAAGGSKDAAVVSNAVVGGSAGLWETDLAYMQNSNIGGDLQFRGLASKERFVIESTSIGNNFDVRMGTGADELFVGATVTVGLNATWRGGLGKNQLVNNSNIVAKTRNFRGNVVDDDAILDATITSLLNAGLL